MTPSRNDFLIVELHYRKIQLCKNNFSFDFASSRAIEVPFSGGTIYSTLFKCQYENGHGATEKSSAGYMLELTCRKLISYDLTLVSKHM